MQEPPLAPKAARGSILAPIQGRALIMPGLPAADDTISLRRARRQGQRAMARQAPSRNAASKTAGRKPSSKRGAGAAPARLPLEKLRLGAPAREPAKISYPLMAPGSAGGSGYRFEIDLAGKARQMALVQISSRLSSENHQLIVGQRRNVIHAVELSQRFLEFLDDAEAEGAADVLYQIMVEHLADHADRIHCENGTLEELAEAVHWALRYLPSWAVGGVPKIGLDFSRLPHLDLQIQNREALSQAMTLASKKALLCPDPNCPAMLALEAIIGYFSPAPVFYQQTKTGNFRRKPSSIKIDLTGSPSSHQALAGRSRLKKLLDRIAMPALFAAIYQDISNIDPRRSLRALVLKEIKNPGTEIEITARVAQATGRSLSEKGRNAEIFFLLCLLAAENAAFIDLATKVFMPGPGWAKAIEALGIDPAQPQEQERSDF